jgi:hypothetical protein
MNILATVNFGNMKIPQHWEIMEGDAEDFIVVNELENGKFLTIRLDRSLIKEVEGVKCYLGTLNVSDAIIIPS